MVANSVLTAIFIIALGAIVADLTDNSSFVIDWVISTGGIFIGALLGMHYARAQALQGLIDAVDEADETYIK